MDTKSLLEFAEAVASGAVRVVDLTFTLSPDFPVIVLPPDVGPMRLAEWMFTLLSELCIPPRTQYFELFVYPGT